MCNGKWVSSREPEAASSSVQPTSVAAPATVPGTFSASRATLHSKPGSAEQALLLRRRLFGQNMRVR